MAEKVVIDFEGKFDNLKQDFNGFKSALSGGFSGLSQMAKGFGGTLSALGPIGMVAGAAIGAAIAGVVVAFKAANAVIQTGIGLIKQWGAAAIAAEKQDLKMKNAVRNSGTGVTVDQISKRASELQSGSIFGDEPIKETMGTFLRTVPTMFDDATRAAINFASATGDDLPVATEKMNAAFANPIRGMMTLRREGVKFTEEQKEQIKTAVALGDRQTAAAIIIDRVAAAFRKGSEEATKSADGGWKQFNEVVGDIQESLGAPFREALKMLQPMLTGIAEHFRDLAEAGEDFGRRVVEGAKKWMPIFQMLVVSAVAGVETAINRSFRSFMLVYMEAKRATVGLTDSENRFAMKMGLDYLKGGTFEQEYARRVKEITDSINAPNTSIDEPNKQTEAAKSAPSQATMDWVRGIGQQLGATISEATKADTTDVFLGIGDAVGQMANLQSNLMGAIGSDLGELAAQMAGGERDPFQARIEDALAMNQRIQAAAASQHDPAVIAAKETAQNTRRLPGLLGDLVTAVKNIKTSTLPVTS